MHGQRIPSELITLILFPFLALLGGREDDPEEDQRDDGSQISWLRSLDDREALFQIMRGNSQFTQSLDAAEALSELGDVRGLDHLIAALNSPSSYLRHRAAQILKQLSHPRALRALKEHRDGSADTAFQQAREPQSGGLSLGARREQLYGDLNRRDTDELVAIGHENDRSQWSDLAFEVIEGIIMERLGKLPRRDDAAGGRGLQDIDENADPRIKDLWMQGDVEGLSRRLMGETDVSMQLEAAEALAYLGDEEALRLLIETLDDPDQDVADMAAEILDWLDLPRGKTALQERGFEFETGTGNMPGQPETQALPTRREAVEPSAHPDSWVAERQAPSAAQVPGIPSAQPVWQGQDIAASVSPAIILTGGIGGLLGLMAFNIGLYFLGMLPPLDAFGAWLRTTLLFYVPLSLAAGAAFGALGSRVAQAIAKRLGQESGEGDLVPVFGALLEGAASAMVVDVLLSSFLGP